MASLAHLPVNAQPASPPDSMRTTQRITVAGLGAAAQIMVDPWGVPHIYAATADDVYFVQGFNAARDRLFQIDLWRRRGLGKLASIFGPDFIEQDRAARLFLYRGDMDREWSAYGANAKRIATRFVAGINAYIDHVGREPAGLPFEFGHFGYAPEKWQPEDVVRIRSHGLTQNLDSEFARAYVACHSDLKSDAVRVRLSPPWETKIPDGLDPCMPYEVMRVFTLATQGVQLSGRAGRRAANGAEHPLALVDAPAALEGSNAWVVSAAKSATGRPILSSDPHRRHSAPSLRYIVHLNAPGLNVIGGGEPALPGVSIGHNGTVAFGLTVFSIDQQDLYVYEINPSNPDEYRYQGQWEKMKTLSEPIPVRGRAAAPAEMRFTRHGPVIYLDRAGGRAYAVRSTWFEPGSAPYFGSIEYMQARNFAEFKRAMAKWRAPSENQLYADVHGTIGWVTGGLAPVRSNWDGLLPVPGDGRYEWSGFRAGEELPSAVDPDTGWIASANEMNLPAGYPYRERKLGFEWAPGSRYARVAERLRSLPKVSIEDSMRLQNDVLSVPARRLQGVLKTVKVDDARAKAAIKLLLEWNLQETGDSAAAALFEVWWKRHLGVVTKNALLPFRAAAIIRSADAELLLDLMEAPGTLLGEDAVAKRDGIIEKSLALAWSDMEKLGGVQPSAWQWSKLHHSYFAHPLASAADAAVRARLDVGPFPSPGGSDTVNLSGFDADNFRQFGGPSFRVVIDVGNWDNSRAMNTPGQSGDPASPHYRDLVPMWLKGEYFPLLYSRARVEAATVQRLELIPAK